MRLYQGFWSIETAGWSIDQSPECITLCPADVEAALQISCHRKSAGEVSLDELRTLARERLPGEAALCEFRCGDFDAISGEFMDDGIVWRNWFLARGKTQLFVSFNCDEGLKDHHRVVVDWMLSTLEAREDE